MYQYRHCSQGPLRFLSRPAARAQTRANVQRYSTVPPPSGSPAPNPLAKKPDNTMLYTVLGLGTAAGAYVYFKGPENTTIQEDAHREKLRLEQKGRETLDDVKGRTNESLRRGERKFDEFKEGSVERMNDARAKIDEASRDFEARGKSIGEDVEDKFRSTKATTSDRLHRARDSTENLYNEARDSTSRKVDDVNRRVDDTKEEVKESWSSWLGWGQSKVNKGVDNTVQEAEAVKRGTAQRVAGTAEDVRDRAAKHA